MEKQPNCGLLLSRTQMLKEEEKKTMKENQQQKTTHICYVCKCSVMSSEAYRNAPKPCMIKSSSRM